MLAWSVGVGLMTLGALLAGFDRSQALLGPAWPWTIALVIDAFVSFSYPSSDPELDQKHRPKSAALH